MSKVTFNKEKSIQILINSLERGRLMGAFSLRDAYAIKQALDFFNPEVETKPTFNDAANPEIAAINIFLQGVQKAQNHGGEYAFTFEEGALLWEIIEFWVNKGGKDVRVDDESSGKKDKGKEKDKDSRAKSSIANVRSKRDVQSDDDDDGHQPGRTNLKSRSGKKFDILEE